jgi:SmpA / OmlA family
MTKRRAAWAGVAAVAVLGLVGHVGQRLLRHAQMARHINEDRFQQIRPGMTEGQVEAILGGPSGDYSTEPIVWASGMQRLPWNPERAQAWTGNEGIITVWFDADGRVTVKHFQPVSTVPTPTPWRRIRDRLGL